MNHTSIQREAENQLAEAMMDNFTLEAVAAIAARLQFVSTDSDDANDQIVWFAEQLVGMLGEKEYARCAISSRAEVPNPRAPAERGTRDEKRQSPHGSDPDRLSSASEPARSSIFPTLFRKRDNSRRTFGSSNE